MLKRKIEESFSCNFKFILRQKEKMEKEINSRYICCFAVQDRMPY